MSWIKNKAGLTHRGKEVNVLGTVLHDSKIYFKVHIIEDNKDIHVLPDWLEDEKSDLNIGAIVRRRGRPRKVK